MTNLTPLRINNYAIPRFFYGTAWKEELTSSLTLAALEQGFRAIDTANQRKHYFEEAVGLGVKKFLESSTVTRQDLFLQTKFTFARGQDHRKPYNEKDSFTAQVTSSFESSLGHLGTDYIDSYVLHGPHGYGIGAADLECWATMESLQKSNKVRLLGISNASAEQLQTLCKNVQLKPAFVQNRCYASKGWDLDVREVCRRENIAYQGFSLLTANRNELSGPVAKGLAQKYAKSIPQIVFRFAQQLQMITLTGTTDPAHMQADLNIYDFELTPAEMQQMENLA